MDWLEDFERKFGGCQEFRDLKERKFHGSVTINFCEGIPHASELKVHLRADKSNNLPIGCISGQRKESINQP